MAHVGRSRFGLRPRFEESAGLGYRSWDAVKDHPAPAQPLVEAITGARVGALLRLPKRMAFVRRFIG
jgi:hypothetical protein